MSHEIRTPPNGIIDARLLMTLPPPDQHEFLRTAYTSSRQSRIVDDISTTQLEVIKLQLESTNNLRDLLNSIVQLMENRPRQKACAEPSSTRPRLAMRGVGARC
jgi:signal transduction histidine kinase